MGKWTDRVPSSKTTSIEPAGAFYAAAADCFANPNMRGEELANLTGSHFGLQTEHQQVR